MRAKLIILLVLLSIAGVIFSREEVRDGLHGLWRRTGGRATIEKRIEQYGDSARKRLKPYFQKSGIDYPPAKLVFVGLKAEKRLEVYAKSSASSMRFVRSYPILAASGGLGPKLKEGDQQVPEGIYKIESLNPNSLFHLSLRVSYPNAFDREQAQKDGRTDLGGDIMIHGGNASIGCLAMGDPAAEELFVLAADTGLGNISVVLSPVDFRRGASIREAAKPPAWTNELYAMIRSSLSELPLPTE